MGYFSFMFADTDNQEALFCGETAYVACPDGTAIYEKCYDGFGRFGGHDIYELVADWNRSFISESNLRKPLRERWENSEEGDVSFKYAMERYEEKCKRIKDFICGKSDEYMKKKYGEEYKRHIGVDIACYDEENAAMRYPIKICKNKPIRYDLLPASMGDPYQGLGEDYFTGEDEIWPFD